jgi:hypothetical protein
MLLVLTACGHADGPTAPSAQGSDESVTWRTWAVSGYRPAEAVPHLERGWMAANAAWGPIPDPTGWSAVLHRDPIPCDWAYPQGCGGIVDVPRQVVHISWWNGEARVWRIAEHEFCHVITAIRTGSPFGPGCVA